MLTWSLFSMAVATTVELRSWSSLWLNLTSLPMYWNALRILMTSFSLSVSIFFCKDFVRESRIGISYTRW